MNTQGRSTNAWLLAALLFCCPLITIQGLPAALANDDPFTLIQVIDTSTFPSPDPVGIVYLPAQDVLLVTDSEVNEMAIFPGFNAYHLSRFGALLDTFSTLGFSDEPTGVAFDAATGTCFFSDDTGTRRIYQVDPGSDGICLTSDDSVTSFRSDSFNSNDPEDVAFTPSALYVVDGVNTQVYRLLPGNNGRYDGAPPEGDDQVSSFDTNSLGLNDPEGIAFNPASNTLYIVGKPQLLVETTLSGQLVRSVDLSSIDAMKPAGITVAPSSVDPAVMSVFITARGVDNDSDPNENDGKIYELNLAGMTPGNEPPGGGELFTRRIEASNDDAEERASGRMKLTSSDLELVFDGGADQTVGLRFDSVQIPPGATITRAYIQFQVDESNQGVTSLVIEGEATVDASPFQATGGNISSRARTAAAIAWTPPPWTVVGAAGPDQQTPDISAIVEEIVGYSGWSLGNALAIIISGTGERTAESFEGRSDAAPLLHVEFTTDTSQQPPAVNAGADQTIDFGDSALLDGAATDDGLPDPPGLLTTQWSLVSGPGSVIFADASTTDTTASFSAPGSYTLRLTADDGQLVTSDEVIITVLGTGGTMTLDVPVTASNDDAEERTSGRMKLTSSDLEFVFDGGGNQTVGMRFNGVAIPPGATILNAYIQFQVDEVNSVSTNLTIEGEAVGNAVAFNASDNNISSRPRTAMSVNWSPPPWITRGEAGPDQRTPDLSPVVAEIVGHTDWSSGNSLVIIITGSGERTAESYDGDSAAAPVLHVEYMDTAP